jgi:hypothetical protein
MEEYSGRSRRWHHPWRGASVAPPPTFPPRRQAPTAATGFCEHHDRTVKSGRCARLSTLSNPPAGIGVLLPRTPWLCHGLRLWMT